MGVLAMVVSFRFSMVANNRNVERPWRFAWPLEANAPLAVDPDGILALAVALEGFQPVGDERGKVGQRNGGIEDAQPLFGLSTERLPLPDFFPGGKPFRIPVTVTPYHPGLYTIIDE
jgi:hypothetical protein